MSAPACPPGWTCKFSQPTPHFVGPWYDGTAGIILASCALAAVVVCVAIVAYYSASIRRARLDAAAQKRREDHELALEEQRTMQADAAKGSPEMLKLIRGDA